MVFRLAKQVSAAALLLLVLVPAPWALAGSSGAPVLARTVVVSVITGRVSIQLTGGHGFFRLVAARAIPVGSTVDTAHGTVKLVTADTTRGGRQFGLFNGGVFVVTQDRSGLTTLRLVGGRSASKVCARRHVAHLASNAAVLRLLHGTAHGKFRTTGRYAAATVRGTMWTTMDDCSGTRVGDRSGQVATQTNNAPLRFPLGPGENVVYRCGQQPPVSTQYCVAILTADTTLIVNGRRVRVFFFSTGLTTKSPDDTHELCIGGPQRTVCNTYPLAPPDQLGFRQSILGCVPEQGPGTYVLTWKIRGVALDRGLSFRSPVAAPVHQSCLAWLGTTSVGSNLASTLNSGYKTVIRYSLPTDALAWKIRIFLHPSGMSGQQVLKGVVYADSGGVPGALLGTTDELTYSSTEPPDWYDLTFPSLLKLTPGDYWIGVIAGDQSGVGGVAYNATPGVLKFNANPYSTGPSDPFGPVVSGDQQLSMYMEYYGPPF